MSKTEMVKEIIGGICFCLLFFCLVGMASLSDSFDEVIIERSAE